MFFGHGIGAVIAFELIRWLRREDGREPQTLFVSGRRAPQIPDSEQAIYNLPRDEFIEKLDKLSGTPKEVLEHEELMELMIPLLKADFQLIETYEYVDSAPLGCPIIVYGGPHGCDVTCNKLLPWKKLTNGRFVAHMLPGDHFFLRSPQALLLKLLAQELRETIDGARMRGWR